MKYLFLIFFLSVSCFADSLDKRVAELNQALNPKTEGQTGYEFDYRSEKDNNESIVWINVNHVKRMCAVATTYTIQNGRIITQTESRCANRWTHDESADILQIMCNESPKNKCTDLLAKEVTLSVVQEMIDKQITEVRVR